MKVRSPTPHGHQASRNPNLIPDLSGDMNGLSVETPRDTKTSPAYARWRKPG